MSVSLYQIYVLCDLQRLPQAGKGTFARKMGGKGGGEVRKVANLLFQRCVSFEMCDPVSHPSGIVVP